LGEFGDFAAFGGKMATHNKIGCQQQNCNLLNVLFSNIDYTDIAGLSSSQNTVGVIGNFQLLYSIISRKRLVIWPRLLLPIGNCISLICC